MKFQKYSEAKRRVIKFESILVDYFGKNEERFKERLFKLSKIELLMFIIHIDILGYNTMEWAVNIKIMLEERVPHKKYDFYIPEENNILNR